MLFFSTLKLCSILCTLAVFSLLGLPVILLFSAGALCLAQVETDVKAIFLFVLVNHCFFLILYVSLILGLT